ncbi:hypothetical protein [Paraburkholderia piptadeniae]|uniref:hypothetical protein n=1 Tax=Paraburkholderia piptadeniae TaxID=1701573 RepID=UPI001358B957|nr:hypothetical protein [Paraburkholderia piptadeniae]
MGFLLLLAPLLEDLHARLKAFHAAPGCPWRRSSRAVSSRLTLPALMRRRLLILLLLTAIAIRLARIRGLVLCRLLIHVRPPFVGCCYVLFVLRQAAFLSCAPSCTSSQSSVVEERDLLDPMTFHDPQYEARVSAKRTAHR